MWFILRQVKGLGHSTMARRFAIGSLEQEKKEYLQHGVLCTRLRECAELQSLHPYKSALEIFVSIDMLKLHSSLTLFTLASSNNKCVFNEFLDQYLEGSYDINSIRMLKQINDQ